VKTSGLIVAVPLALALLLPAGCGKDRGKEYFDALEQKEAEAKAGSKSGSQGPEIDLSELTAPKPKPDDGVPPPKLVDTREIREDYADGTIRVACGVKYYSDGSTVKHGPYTEWHPNGTKFKEGQYEDGKMIGEWTFYFDDGKKAKSGSYKANEACGVWTYWRPDGSKHREESYRDGNRHGPWTVWHANGQKAIEEHYVDDKLDGKRIAWDKDGKKTAELVYRKGVLVERIAVTKG